MSKLVAPTEIEGIVGARRDPTDHLGRAVSAERTVYILHSRACKDSGIDLRDCPYSRALDQGIDLGRWVEDVPTKLCIEDGELLQDDIDV